jgi:hypothetical protein
MLPSPKQIARIEQRATSRIVLRRTKAAVWCPVCRTIQRIDDVLHLAREYRLACQHKREIQ